MTPFSPWTDRRRRMSNPMAPSPLFNRILAAIDQPGEPGPPVITAARLAARERAGLVSRVRTRDSIDGAGSDKPLRTWSAGSAAR